MKRKTIKIIAVFLAVFMFSGIFQIMPVYAAADIKTLAPYQLTAANIRPGDAFAGGAVKLTFKINSLPRSSGSLIYNVIIEYDLGGGFTLVGMLDVNELIDYFQISKDTYVTYFEWTDADNIYGVTTAKFRTATVLQDIADKSGGRNKMSDYSNVVTVNLAVFQTQTQPHTQTQTQSATSEPKAYNWSKASDWALDELSSAVADNLYPEKLVAADLTKPITRMEFAAAAVKLYEAMSGETASPAPYDTFSDTRDADVLKAYSLGITNGTGGGKFSPDDILTREQAAAMLMRTFKKVYWNGWTLANDAAYAEYKLRTYETNKFADDKDISDYAKESVYAMFGAEIIKGVGGNLFAPKDTATREQALLISKRTYENAANLWKDWTVSGK